MTEKELPPDRAKRDAELRSLLDAAFNRLDAKVDKIIELIDQIKRDLHK